MGNQPQSPEPPYKLTGLDLDSELKSDDSVSVTDENNLNSIPFA